jgi:hypothetical protein
LPKASDRPSASDGARVVLQTNDATMAEIIAALRSAFDLEVTLKGATARKFTGVYSGS